MRNKPTELLGFVLAGLLLSGCATFPGNKLPKQSTKPQLMKKDCLVTEFVVFDKTTAMAGTPDEYFAPNLKNIITDSGGTHPTEEKIEREIKSKVAVAIASYNLLPMNEKILMEYGGQMYSMASVASVGSFSITLPDTRVIAARYEKQFREELYAKMRNDATFREKMLPPDAVWFDCTTSLVEGNASTWFLEGLLCSCSLTLLPAHHNKVLHVRISVYENGKVYKREYTDYWNAVFWLPLFPIGLAQGDWPDPKIVKAILDNMALTAINDFQKEHGSR